MVVKAISFRTVGDPGIAEVSVFHPAGTSPGDTSPRPPHVGFVTSTVRQHQGILMRGNLLGRCGRGKTNATLRVSCLTSPGLRVLSGKVQRCWRVWLVQTSLLRHQSRLLALLKEQALSGEGQELQYIKAAAERVSLGPARVWQVGLGAERLLASHPPVLGHFLLVVPSVEVPQLLQQSRSQHVIHPLLQPLVQSWEEESRTHSAT